MRFETKDFVFDWLTMKFLISLGLNRSLIIEEPRKSSTKSSQRTSADSSRNKTESSRTTSRSSRRSPKSSRTRPARSPSPPPVHKIKSTARPPPKVGHDRQPDLLPNVPDIQPVPTAKLPTRLVHSHGLVSSHEGSECLILKGRIHNVSCL